MSIAGHRLRIASRIVSLGLALLVIRAAVACGGSDSEVESDSCKMRQGHCASGGLTATCNREEVAFVDTCLCCVPADLVSGDDDDAATPDAAGDDAASDAGSVDSATPTDSGPADAADASG